MSSSPRPAALIAPSKRRRAAMCFSLGSSPPGAVDLARTGSQRMVMLAGSCARS
jgi:hypothetical protein